MITDIQMPFDRLVAFWFKAALAVIPLVVVLVLLSWFLQGMLRAA